MMKENVEHHIEEEEDDMFPKARDVIGDQLEALEAQMQSRRVGLGQRERA
ncbi:MAG: hypothetical protein ABI572_07555 [Actinomycetota bacterium]